MLFRKLDYPQPHIDVSDSLRVFISEVQAPGQCTDMRYKISEHD
jgi:hypothetical protein